MKTRAAWIDPASRGALVAEARRAFAAQYGVKPEAVGCAPGRINIIGEHTDYSGGFVLPAAIPLYTVVAAGRNRSRTSRLSSTGFGQVSFPATVRSKSGGFEDYVAGAVRESGLSGTGLDIGVHSNLPAEAGLSSSASVLVAALGCFARLRSEGVDPFDLAVRARKVENEFIGVPCGFMDQFACACSRPDRATLLDCMDLSRVSVPASFPDAGWLVIYSGVRRELKAGGYKEKVVRTRAAVQKVLAGKTEAPDFLRVLQQKDVERIGRACRVSAADVPLLQHVCAENYRVHAMRTALEKGSAAEAARLLDLGHRSLSELFRVSTPQLDRLCEHARGVPGVLGIRLTGAGMGGSLVAIAESSRMERAAVAVETYLRKNVSKDGRVYCVRRLSGGVTTWTR